MNNTTHDIENRQLAEYLLREARRRDTHTARHGEAIDFSELLGQLATLPPETPEQITAREARIAGAVTAERLARFRRICPDEFMKRIDRANITNHNSFDAVAGWDGKFPGPLATGPTGTAKTRAAWSALGRLSVREGRSIAWFTARRLITEFARYEARDWADEFWRFYKGFNIILIDDLDKLNWQFESEGAALFQFVDWVYRENRPVVATTNKDRSWWTDKMGEAFARRLFDDAHAPVYF